MVNAFSCNTFKNLTTEPVLAITSLPLKVNSWPLPQGYYLQKAILEGWGKKAGRKGKQSEFCGQPLQDKKAFNIRECFGDE